YLCRGVVTISYLQFASCDNTSTAAHSLRIFQNTFLHCLIALHTGATSACPQTLLDATSYSSPRALLQSIRPLEKHRAFQEKIAVCSQRSCSLFHKSAVALFLPLHNLQP